MVTRRASGGAGSKGGLDGWRGLRSLYAIDVRELGEVLLFLTL